MIGQIDPIGIMTASLISLQGIDFNERNATEYALTFVTTGGLTQNYMTYGSEISFINSELKSSQKEIGYELSRIKVFN